jgi:predicted TIM-barrel fold metal-dependent hydrolase
MADTLVKYDVVSCDDHVDLNYFPRDLWESRVSSKWRDRVPKVVERDDGPTWVCDGDVLGVWGDPSARMAIPGLRGAFARANRPVEVDGKFRPTDPALRLEDMEFDGVDLHVLYGPPIRMRIKDPLLNYEVLKAYNDWVFSFEEAAPGRFIPIGVLPVHDGQAAVDELTRLAEKGFRGAEFGTYVAAHPLWSEEWDPLWAAAAETGIAMSFHIGGGHSVAIPSADDPAQQGRGVFPAFTATAPMQADEVLASMIFCGALEKNPTLKVVSGESDFSWLPYMLDRADQQWVTGLTRNLTTLTMKPSDYFFRQCYVGFEEDHIGLAMIQHDIVPGLENNVMWSSDYPHPVSTWPHSREKIDEMFAKIPDDKKIKILRDNTLRVYGL